MQVNLTEKEMAAIKVLSNKMDISEERILIRGLRILQLIESGFAELKYTGSDMKVGTNGID
jgi:hypothetical protein